MKLENIKNSIKVKTRNVRKLIANWIYPESATPDFLDAQMQYIKVLQDNTCTLYKLLSEMATPVIEANKLMRAELKVQREYNLQLTSSESKN